MKNINKFILLVIFILIYIWVLLVFSVKAFDNNLIFSTHTFEIKPEIVYMDYEEPDIEPWDKSVESDGFLYGISGKYTYHGIYNIMGELDLEWISGELNYDGFTWRGVPLQTDSDDSIFQVRGLIGYDIKKETYAITLFTGFGFRYWRDRIEEEWGYKRIVRYWYSPIGIRLTVPLSYIREPEGKVYLKWSWGINAEYDIFWKGEVKSYLSDVDPGFNDPENDQDPFDGYGLRFSLWVKRNINKNVAFSIEPFVRYWWVAKSESATLTYYGNPIGYVWEPKNRTYIYGIFLNFSF